MTSARTHAFALTVQSVKNDRQLRFNGKLLSGKRARDRRKKTKEKFKYTQRRQRQQRTE